MNVLRFLQTVDRRFLYAMLFLSVAVPLLKPVSLPVDVSPQTKAFYNAIEDLPPNSFVLIGMDWAASTRGENGAQTEALIRHLMKRKLRFAMIAFDPQGKTLGEDIALKLQDQYHYKEGVNWVNWGYKAADPTNTLKALDLNIPQLVQTDIHGTPIALDPVMQGIHSMRDVSMVIDITGSATYQTYIQFVQGPYKENLKMGVALTAVMAPEALNYVQSGQLVGVVVGLKGAVEYEKQLGVKGKATSANASLSFAHLLIIFFILLGNVAMNLERRRAAQEGHP